MLWFFSFFQVAQPAVSGSIDLFEGLAGLLLGYAAVLRYSGRTPEIYRFQTTPEVSASNNGMAKIEIKFQLDKTIQLLSLIKVLVGIQSLFLNEYAYVLFIQGFIAWL